MKRIETIKTIAIILLTASIAIFLGNQLPFFLKKWRGPFKEGDYQAHVARHEAKLTLYGTTTCPHCQSAREYLQKSGIPFNDLVIDRSESAAKSFKQLKESAVPVLVSAKLIVVGFDQKAYSELNERVNKN